MEMKLRTTSPALTKVYMIQLQLLKTQEQKI